MKKIISISILAVYMLCCTEFDQLLRVPLLVTHFVEHKQDNEGISFSEFMLIHYVAEYSIDGDYEQDMNLPFKMVDGNTIQVVAFIPPLRSDLKNKPVYTENEKYNRYEECFRYNAYFSSIWQPPKYS